MLCNHNPTKTDPSLNFLSGLEKEEIYKVLHKVFSKTVVFSKNTDIGGVDNGAYLMYLLKGNVTASVTLKNGKWIPLRYIRAGEIFGVSSICELSDNIVFCTTCQSTVKFIKKNEFLNLLETHPRLLSNYLSFLNHRIHFLLNKIILFSIQNNRQRIAYYFLNETHKQKNTLLHINLSKTCILEYLGISRGSFYRELNGLIEEGAIEIIDNKRYLCHWEVLNNILCE